MFKGNLLGGAGPWHELVPEQDFSPEYPKPLSVVYSKPREFIDPSGVKKYLLIGEDGGLVWREPKMGEESDDYIWKGSEWVAKGNLSPQENEIRGPWKYDGENWVYNSTNKPSEDGTFMNETKGSWRWNTTSNSWIELQRDRLDGGRKNRKSQKKRTKRKSAKRKSVKRKGSKRKRLFSKKR